MDERTEPDDRPGIDEAPRRPVRARRAPFSGRRSIAAWLPAVAWAGLIFAFSAQPNLRFVPDEGLDFLVRKAGHMAVFGILALLAWRAVATTAAWRRPWAWALALAVLYAITDEFHQGFVAGRHPSPVDVGIDATGALIAVATVTVARARRA
jgi:VanZ family protein